MIDALVYITHVNIFIFMLLSERFTGLVWTSWEASEQPTRRSKMCAALVLHSGKLLLYLQCFIATSFVKSR